MSSTLLSDGMQYLAGAGIRPDPARGFTLIEQAADAGDPQGAWLAATINSCSFWRPVNWQCALDYLVLAARLGHGPAQSSLQILAGGPLGDPANGDDWEQMRSTVDLAAWFTAAPVTQLRESPSLYVIEKFLSPAVCDWVIAQARDGLVRATIYDKVTGGTTADNRRTNSECELGIDRCGVLTFVIRGRIAAITGKVDNAMEVPKVLHYAPGETFANHFDFLNPKEPAYAAQLAERGQRTHTLLVYLNEEYEGGETHFPKIDFKNRGARGDAFLFANVDAAGEPDYLTMHAGLAPESGEKWLFSQWIRGKP